MSASQAGSNGSTLNCNMAGYQTLVQELVGTALAVVTMAISIGEAILPADLALSLDLAYKFLKSAPGWIGYVLAAAYYIAEDQGFGSYLCQGAQYGYLALYYMNVVLTFGKNLA